MFRRSSKAVGHIRNQLGLWEFRTESEASAMIQQRQEKKGDSGYPEPNRPLPNFGRQILWGPK